MVASCTCALAVHASDPSFVFSVIPGSDRVTRLLPPPPDLSPALGQPRPCWRGQAPSSASGAPLLNSHRFQLPRPQRGAAGEGEGPLKQNPQAFQRPPLWGLPGLTGASGPPPSGRVASGSTGPACARPAGTFSTHCLPSLNGPTVIRRRSLPPVPLCYAPRFLGALTTDGCYT